MINQLLSGMVKLTLAKFCLNDVPHASGILEGKDYGAPATPGQIRYIAILCQQLGITTPYEERIRTRGEAGVFIRELEAERRYRKRR